MALQYETGTTSGSLDLLDKLATFITTYGQNTSVARLDDPGDITGFPNDRQVVLLFSTPSVYVAFQTDLDAANNKRVWFQPATGLGVAGTPFTGHSGSYSGGHASLTKSGVSCPASGSTFTYHFFHDDGWVYIVLKFDGGFYQHAFAGQLETIGSHAYGFYVCGMTGSSVVNEDYNYTTLSLDALRNPHPIGGGSHALSPGRNAGSVRNHDGDWIPIHQGSYSTETELIGFAQTMQGFPTGRYTSSSYSLGSPPPHHLSTNFVQVFRRVLLFEPHVTLAGTDGNIAPVGYIPGAFYTSNEVIPEDTVVTIGADDYIVFPLRSRQVEHRERYSAVALLKP